MKITRIRVVNYRGIEEQDVEPSAAGVVASGRNGGGKTTFLKAVKAALLAQDVSADAIRKGTDRAEIVVDMDDVSVRRVITPKTSTVTVSRGGMKASAPQAFLREMLGVSDLDPMALLTMKGKERRAAILAAMPVSVTIEQLRRWWPRCPDDYDVSGHGLEVVERIRKRAYDRRSEVNKEAKEAKSEAARLSDAAKVSLSVAPASRPDIEAARAAEAFAKAAMVAATTRAAEHAKSMERSAKTLDQAKNLRAQASAYNTESPVSDECMSQLQESKASAVERWEAARKELEAAESAMTESERALQRAYQILEEHKQDMKRRNLLLSQADELESAVAAMTSQGASEEEISSAREAAKTAAKSLADAIAEAAAYDSAKAAREAADAASKSWNSTAAEAARLDGVVRALTNDAPAELLAQCDGIHGLSLEGDEVKLDGISLDSLCGAEQVRFCAEVAKRANARGKILVVDGLERLDPEQYDAFVHEVIGSGYQLIASRVDRGEVVYESLQLESVATADAAE